MVVRLFLNSLYCIVVYVTWVNRHKKTTAARYVCETQESEIATKPRIHFSRSIWCISATQSFFSIVTLKFLRHFVLICAAPCSSRLKSTAATVHPVPVTTLKPVYNYMAAHYPFQKFVVNLADAYDKNVHTRKIEDRKKTNQNPCQEQILQLKSISTILKHSCADYLIYWLRRSSLVLGIYNVKISKILSSSLNFEKQ